MDLKHVSISIAMLAFVLSSMIGMGLGLRVAEIGAPLRNWRVVMVVVVAVVGLLILPPLSRAVATRSAA